MFLRNGMFLLFCVVSQNLSAYTLKDDITDTLKINPVVQERLKNFRATQQDLNIAYSEYYPRLDLRMSATYNKAGTDNKTILSQDVKNIEYQSYKSSLTLTQNLFDGFSTENKVAYQETRVMASAYNYLEKANDIAFQMTQAYINVFRTYEQVQISQENIRINESMYQKVNNLYNSGLTSYSEVRKVQSSLALARSNLIVQKNNALDAEYNYRRILGRMPNILKMKKPVFNIELPENIESAALYAIEHNPSLLVSKYNIEGVRKLKKQREKEYYPKIDLEATKTYDDASKKNNGFDSPDDRFKVGFVLTYNLFKGGADKAEVQKNISKINQEIEIKRDLKRQVIEGLDLSWDAYSMIGKQLVDLKKYNAFAVETLTLYEEEYDLGRRSLLDLLSAQNDVINARQQIVSAEYDQLFAKYRILDAMGILVVSVVGDTKEVASKVNLALDDDMAHEVLDTLNVNHDLDIDKVVEKGDLCDNSIKKSIVRYDGCKDIKLLPFDLDYGDKDNDGVKDSIDLCPNTPEGYKVDKHGCTMLITLHVNFDNDSSILYEELREKIIRFADYLKDHENIKAEITGYASRTKVSKKLYNIKLSEQRAKKLKEALISYGVDASRLVSRGKGFADPIADNNTEAGRAENRRLEIRLTREAVGK